MKALTNFEAPRVWLAPMSGSTDAPFRRQAVRFGAPAVVSEMTASEALVRARPDVVRRTCRHDGGGAWIVQLAGRRPDDMRAGASILARAGVDVIDINMGCPSRQVTGGASGSALMRDPALAQAIVEATIDGAEGVPVTLKMRLGWDDQMLNAPALGAMAERAGVRMLTVHGRTRCQFYKGDADWARIRDTVASVAIPVIANGDIDGPAAAHAALDASGAHGVMVGRAAMGRPWLAGQIAAALDGRAYRDPPLDIQCDSLCEQVEDSVALYGERLGVRMVRKHVSAALDATRLSVDAATRRALRAELCQLESASALVASLRAVYGAETAEIAA
ncbi:MAG: tRNA dihydrouridine synthase DusB [Pseudomonadota bacterium]